MLFSVWSRYCLKMNMSCPNPDEGPDWFPAERLQCSAYFKGSSYLFLIRRGLDCWATHQQLMSAPKQITAIFLFAFFVIVLAACNYYSWHCRIQGILVSVCIHSINWPFWLYLIVDKVDRQETEWEEWHWANNPTGLLRDWYALYSTSKGTQY